MTGIRYRNYINEQQIEQHVAQTHELWGGRTSPDERLGSLRKRLLEAGQDAFFLSGLVDAHEKLIASMKRYYFPVRIRGTRVQAIGLGAIFTLPEARQRGLASALIQRVLAESKSEFGCRAAVLYSDIEPRYYQRFGFVEAPSLNWVVATGELRDSEPLETRVACPDDIDRMIGWYDQMVRRFPVHFERTPETWKLFREVNDVGRDLILMDQGAEVGFLSVTPNPQKCHLWVEEWCAPKELEPRVWGTIRKLAEEGGFEKIRGWVLPSFHLKGSRTEARQGAVPMVAALDTESPITSAEIMNAYFASPDHF